MFFLVKGERIDLTLSPAKTSSATGTVCPYVLGTIKRAVNTSGAFRNHVRVLLLSLWHGTGCLVGRMKTRKSSLSSGWVCSWIDCSMFSLLRQNQCCVLNWNLPMHIIHTIMVPNVLTAEFASIVSRLASRDLRRKLESSIFNFILFCPSGTNKLANWSRRTEILFRRIALYDNGIAIGNVIASTTKVREYWASMHC